MIAKRAILRELSNIQEEIILNNYQIVKFHQIKLISILKVPQLFQEPTHILLHSTILP